MKIFAAFVATLLLALSFQAHGAVQARDSAGNVVTLKGDACVNAAVIGQIPRLNKVLADAGQPPKTVADFISAEVFFQGKVYQACATDFQNVVIVIDDAGLENSIFLVPAQDFRLQPDI